MYWVYLITLTFTVSVPTLITQGYWIFDLRTTQEIAILLLGLICFVIFLVMEKSLNRLQAEKSLFQRQVTRMSKDLTNSYSYIGETNRKLDILENIARGYPESSQIISKDSEEAFDSILGAVQTFGKSDEFVLRFVKNSQFEIIQEIKNAPDSALIYPSMKWEEEGKHYFEDDEFIYISSPKAVENIFACLIIKKKQSSHHIEDREMMKTLVSQALFIFMFMRQRKQIKCVI